MSEQQTGISVHTGFFPLMFLLYMFKPAIKIDGVKTQLAWGPSFVPTTAGNHDVEVYYDYLFGPTSPGRMTVDVPEGGQVSLKYTAPPIIFMDGNLTLES